MREDTKITKVYYFFELGEKAQQKALEQLSDINVDYDWWEFIYEDAVNIGVKIKEFGLGRGSYCRGEFTLDEQGVAELILQKHGKGCETYADAYEFLWDLASEEDVFYKKAHSQTEEDEYNREDVEDDFDADHECPDLLDDFRVAIFEDYRAMLQEQYDYLTSEEAIRETINANKYEFTEDGKLYV